jgi:type IV pilus assembly protein PilB
MPPIKTFGERIADALVEDGLLTTKQIQELLEQQKKDGTRLLKLVVEKAYVNEMDMVVSMGRVLNTLPVNLARISIPQDIVELLPREIATNHKVLPVSRLGDRLFLAMADPLNVLALDDVKRITKLDVTPLIASEKTILDKLNNLDTAKGTMEDIISDAAKQAEVDREADDLELSKESTEEVNLDQLAASVEEGPVIKYNLIPGKRSKRPVTSTEPFEKGDCATV